jgi:hypothetical protein
MMSDLPRRFAQRQTLRHDRGSASSPLQNGQRQAYESRVKLKRRHRMRPPCSTHDGYPVVASCSDIAKDSGYNSLPDGDSDSDSAGQAEGVNIEQMIQEFEEEGVTLSNPCHATKMMMEAELQKWEE